jgi:hypothetical protein
MSQRHLSPRTEQGGFAAPFDLRFIRGPVPLSS